MQPAVVVWHLFIALKVAVNDMELSAVRRLRNCDLTVAAELVVGGGTDAHATSAGRPFNVHLLESSISPYAHDTALALYIFVRLVDVSGLSHAKAPADGRQVPALSTRTIQVDIRVRSGFEAAMTAPAAVPPALAVCDSGGSGIPAPSERTGEKLGEVFVFYDRVRSLICAIFHEQYDPRLEAAGGTSKAHADMSLVMPLLALRYPRSSSSSPRERHQPEVAYMDASGAQHPAAALLFATRVLNALVFLVDGSRSSAQSSATGRSRAAGAGSLPSTGTLSQSFSVTAEATNPSSTTAAAYIVMFYARAEMMSRAEAVATAFLPCEDLSHVAEGPRTADCGVLLDRCCSPSKVKLGGLAEAL